MLPESEAAWYSLELTLKCPVLLELYLLLQLCVHKELS